MKLSHRLLYSFICAMLLMPALFSGCSESQAEPNTPDNTEQEDMPLTPAQDTEVPAYAAAYLEVAKAYEEEYAANPGDSDNPPRYALVDFDGDETPELVISQGTMISLYKFVGNKVYTLMDGWGFDIGGILPYTYLPGKNTLYGAYYQDAGAICFETYYGINDRYHLDALYNQLLYTTTFSDKNHNFFRDKDEPLTPDTIHYYYGSSELSEEDYASMIIPGDFEPLIGTMTLAELEAALA